MRLSLLDLLRCPYCGGSLDPSLRLPTSGESMESGLLTCECSDFPVLGGIPIFRREGRVDVMEQTRDRAERRGPDLETLKSLIRSGDSEKALLLLLVPPDSRTRRLLRLQRFLPGRFRTAAGRLAYATWMRRARRHSSLFTGDVSQTTARDAFSFYYGGSAKDENYNYFGYRFGQPRHLAALSLATLLPGPPAPIFDLACGFGHLLHYWTSARPGQTAVGADRNFFQLYAAGRWIAPGADYVCCDGDQTLPFRTGGFGGVFCSDAFHYFPRKVQAAREIRRLTAEKGVIVLTRVGNSGLAPHEGYELSPAGYLRLFEGWISRVVPDREVFRRYLEGLGASLAEPVSLDSLAREKWLTIVASRTPQVFREHGKLEPWPHAAGRWAINPLYLESGKDAQGHPRFQFAFPSPWYAYENAEAREYMPKSFTVSEETLRGLKAGERPGPAAALVASFAVMGFPDRYL